MWPAKLKRIMNWSFTKKVCQPLLQTKSSMMARTTGKEKRESSMNSDVSTPAKYKTSTQASHSSRVSLRLQVVATQFFNCTKGPLTLGLCVLTFSVERSLCTSSSDQLYHMSSRSVLWCPAPSLGSHLKPFITLSTS